MERENEQYLSSQLITYLGNKRALLPFIGEGVELVLRRLGKKKLSFFDVFSGSGIVSRFMKQYSTLLLANDLENYPRVINSCYLSNREEIPLDLLRESHEWLRECLAEDTLRAGLITELYAPVHDEKICPGERVFYTNRNARYLDTARQSIDTLPARIRKFFLAPLLAEASVHANTSGVFKGFYKNSETGLGQFGGKKADALSRIRGNIDLPFPVFSRFSCETRLFTANANTLVLSVPEVDLAYVDPPYNQHPYGSNYFMLNLLLDYRKPASISAVSGIPPDWNRSDYNKRRLACGALSRLLDELRAKFVLISFNSDGFIRPEAMAALLEPLGSVTVLETGYNTFRGSRNLNGRSLHVKEYLYVLEKKT